MSAPKSIDPAAWRMQQWVRLWNPTSCSLQKSTLRHFLLRLNFVKNRRGKINSWVPVSVSVHMMCILCVHTCRPSTQTDLWIFAVPMLCLYCFLDKTRFTSTCQNDTHMGEMCQKLKFFRGKKMDFKTPAKSDFQMMDKTVSPIEFWKWGRAKIINLVRGKIERPQTRLV